MLRHVGFRHHLKVHVIDGQTVCLLSQDGVTTLRGRGIDQLVPLLDGTRTLTGVLREAPATLPPIEVGRALSQLAKAKLIGYRCATPESPATGTDHAYWDAVGLDSLQAAAALAATPVRLIVLGNCDRDAAVAACRDNGLIVCDDAGGEPAPGFSLVLCDDYLAPELAGIDARHRAEGLPWLLAKPSGTQPWIGPVFQPGDGPCWACLAHRLRGHVPLRLALGAGEPFSVPEASLAAGRSLGLQMAVLESAKWLAGLRHPGNSAVFSVDSTTLSTHHHPVIRRPQCPECGDAGLVAAQVLRPFEPRQRSKAVHAGGSQRAVQPEEMLRRFGHLVDPVTGIVDRIRPARYATDTLHAAVSGPNLAFQTRTLDGVCSNLRSLSGGKGTTAVEAEVGALCEAAERYCGTRQGDEPTVVDTLDALGDRAIHPNACQLFHQRQFDDRDRWNATHSMFHQVCAPFDSAAPVEWTPVWSVSARTHKALPTSMLYYTPRHAGADTGLPWADSNGNAAGSSREDAIVQGALELVERDAVAQWWYNRTRQPAVDLDSFDEPWLRRIRAAHDRRRRSLWALDLTSDLGIPAVVALSARATGDQSGAQICLGFGAHFDPAIALRRAVTELGQFLASIEPADPTAPADVADDAELAAWWSRATTENQPYLLPDPAESPRTPASFGYTPTPDFRQDIETLDGVVREHGMELLVLDQTRPDVAIPVVKVIVPGLRHFWARYAPGRLYDVPVRLGRLSRPTPPADLNPIPLFL